METQGQAEETPSAEPAQVPAPPSAGRTPGTEGPARRSVRDEKGRKKDDKSVEYVLRTLSMLSSPEDKLAAMCKKYAEVVDDNRKLQSSAKQAEKRLGVLQREKEQLQTEHSKAVLTRSRLESLCRELQRQNKAVKDESLLKIREEEEKRKEVSNKFQSTLTEITTLMQQNNEKNSKLREDNLEMTKKFKSLCEQYETREQQVEKMTRQMQLESQLSDAKMAKVQLEIAAEKEVLLREKQQILLELQEYQTKCQDLQATEAGLRSQISLYTDKYDEFQDALSRSNQVFTGFKGEMDKMSKKVGKLQKEALMWKGRWEKSHQTLLEMAEDKQKRDAELAQSSRKLVQLQKLCRTLQAERTALHSQLRALDVEGQPGDAAGSITSELQSVCDRLTETLDGLQLPPESTLDQAECPSKVRSKSCRSSGDASAGATTTAACAATSSLPGVTSCSRAVDTGTPAEGSVLVLEDVAASQDPGDKTEASDGLVEADNNEIPTQQADPTAESEGVMSLPETENVVILDFGICSTSSSPDVNCNVCSLALPQLDCSASAAVPVREVDVSKEASAVVDLQPPTSCSKEENKLPDSNALSQSLLPDKANVCCTAAQVDVVSAGKTGTSEDCTVVSDEILFKPIANGHAILLPEENLSLVMNTPNEAKKGKDAGKKRKK